MKRLLALLILAGFLTAGIGCGGTTTKATGGGGSAAPRTKESGGSAAPRTKESGGSAAPRTKETFRDVAGRMVKAINAADYEGIRKDFNKEMLEAFPVEKRRTFFSKEISGKFGKINKLEPPQFKTAAEAVFVARCERGALDFALVLDDQGRVAGMLFLPHSDDGASRSDGPARASLTGLITGLRKEKKLVGLAAMVMVDGKVVSSAAHGERKKDSDVTIELGDRWHLGSITKSITATMIARLVESGQMKWTDTVGERFSDASIHEDWNPVTLKQLLTHTSGAPANFSLEVRQKKPALGPECTQERRKAVIDVMAEKPARPPGEKYYAGKKVGQAFQPDSAAASGWKA